MECQVFRSRSDVADVKLYKDHAEREPSRKGSSEDDGSTINQTMDMYISSSAWDTTPYQSLHTSGLRTAAMAPYPQHKRKSSPDEIQLSDHEPDERLSAEEPYEEPHLLSNHPKATGRSSTLRSSYVDVRDKGWREGWFLVTMLDEAGKRGDLRAWKSILDLYQSAMTARECVVRF
jgi:hypothetical protein